jgi:hypothetical protein
VTVPRRRLALAVVALILGSTVATAAATAFVRTDPDDTRSPLDLRRLRISHETAGEVFRVATREGFRDEHVDGERGWLRIGFANASGDGWRRSVYVYTLEGELRGVVAARDGSFLRFVEVRRIAEDRLAVHVPTTVSGGAPYRFAVWSVWNRRPCSRTAPCVDWLPDAGTIRHGA